MRGLLCGASSPPAATSAGTKLCSDDVVRLFIEWIAGAVARASVISSLLTLECSANCCIEALPWSRRLRDEIDKLPSLSKLDLFVKHLDSSKSIDRGAFAVQGVEELKGLRDHYVHPHVRKSEWKQQSEQERILDLGRSSVLRVPYDIGDWGPKVESSLSAQQASLQLLLH